MESCNKHFDGILTTVLTPKAMSANVQYMKTLCFDDEKSKVTKLEAFMKKPLKRLKKLILSLKLPLKHISIGKPTIRKDHRVII